MPSETTFCFEDHLPRFPVPDFKDTLKRYLASARIIVSDKQYKKTEALVKEFGKQGGIGEQLHEAIVERAKTTDNWLTDWWTKYVYLKPRESIVLNISVATIAGYEPVQSEDDYITLAAKAAVATATYYWQIYHQTLPVNKSGGAPLAMFQSMNLFGSSRIPKHSIDEFTPRNLDDEPSSDLIISHNNQFFTVKAIKDDKVISFTEMKIQIQRVIQMSTEVVEPVGILTTADRETWADALQLLTQDPENYQSWHAIHRAISVISLEMIKCEPNVQPDHPNYQDELYSLFTSEGLHANGSQYNSANRWNDKIVACYVGRHGNYGTLGEHSHVDGVTVVYYNVFLDQQIKMMETGKSVPQEVSNQVEPPKKIQWRLNDELHQVIRQTAEKFDKTLKNVNQRGMIFNDYGKEFIKSIGISPDSFIQMALQLTYYILERKLPNQYESCTLARYARGRTEAIRATTPKSKILCKIWIDPKSTVKNKFNAMATINWDLKHSFF
ncbi:Choline O-acetyltransferase [Trichoplax sp. H2]|nr:Choline O-acetyltransferase [Trichoplax sp. H2]|eukprot:RDD36519.1 Choline O-acetyltransferase [Trichoplax sp. H2]